MVTLGALALVLVTLDSRGSAESHLSTFLAASFGVPLASVLVTRGSVLWRVGVGLGSASIVVALYAAIVDYLDQPWLAGPETHSCDGPCFGWYTFEFEPPYALLCSFAFAGISLGEGARARWAARSRRRTAVRRRAD